LATAQSARGSIFLFLDRKKGMETQFTDLLSKYHPAIRQHVDLATLIPHMNAAGLVSTEDISFLNNRLYPISSRIDYLIFCLPRKGKDAESLFIECLEKAADHRGHTTLSKILHKAISERPPIDLAVGPVKV